MHPLTRLALAAVTLTALSGATACGRSQPIPQGEGTGEWTAAEYRQFETGAACDQAGGTVGICEVMCDDLRISACPEKWTCSKKGERSIGCPPGFECRDGGRCVHPKLKIEYTDGSEAPCSTCPDETVERLRCDEAGGMYDLGSREDGPAWFECEASCAGATCPAGYSCAPGGNCWHESLRYCTTCGMGIKAVRKQ